MLYKYKAVLNTGESREGTVEAGSIDFAINLLQNKGLVLSSIKPVDDSSHLLNINISFLDRVSSKDVVILSRQLATLFEAQVSALRIFQILATQSDNKVLGKHLAEVASDIQGGMSISKAMARHPDIFSEFYVNMVLAGEESGKLNETFTFLADYMDRTYEVVSKAKNALIYPLFVITTFIAVMALMFTVIIPKIALIIKDSGQEVPIYTKIVMGISDFFVAYWIYLLVGLILTGVAIWRYSLTKEGSNYIAKLKLTIPYMGNLYRKLYLSRIADNLNTMILSGIPMLRALEITASVVDNVIYKQLITESLISVKEGTSLSNAFSRYDLYIPSIMVSMIKVGEETGELGSILKTLSKFYQREVTNAVDTMVSLIEPVMIVALGLGVGSLLASVLMPIYNIASV